jgi:uncharacterized membrane protein
MKKAILFCTLMFVLEMVIGACLLPTLPSQIPLHWDANGNVDNWGDPWTIFLCPLISAAVVLITYFSFRVEKLNLLFHLGRKSSEKIDAIALIVSKLFFTAMFIWIILFAKEDTNKIFQIDRIIFILCGVMLIAMGVFIAKFPQNSVLGVRTPWTLKSSFVLKKTNVLGGILIAISGIGFIICQLVMPSYMNMWLPLGLLLLCMPILLIYSFKIYKTNQ